MVYFNVSQSNFYFFQTDYNRHLEELIERTENLLINALRITLVKQNHQVSELYEQLEGIKQLSNGN